jgi:DNA-binding MarR family transcriptional regulator
MIKKRETIGKYVAILSRLGNAYLAKNFAEYNLGCGQYPYLLYLNRNNGVTQEEMSLSLIIDKGTTAKAIKKLELEGYVYREVDENDKRAYKVYLTEKAKKIMEHIYSVLDAWENIITSDFSDEEKKVALKLLQRMVENKNNFMRKES